MGRTLPVLGPFLNIMTYKVQNLTINGTSIDGVLGIRTRDHRMVGAHESTEQWRHPSFRLLTHEAQRNNMLSESRCLATKSTVSTYHQSVRFAFLCVRGRGNYSRQQQIYQCQALSTRRQFLDKVIILFYHLEILP